MPTDRVGVCKRSSLKTRRGPRVLLIGDSILNGYLGGVQSALKDKAYVDAWVTPTSQGDKSLPRQIREVLAQGPYDIIPFQPRTARLAEGPDSRGSV